MRNSPSLVRAALAAIVVLIAGAARADYVTINVAPTSVATQRGSTGAQPLSVLAQKDLTGTTTEPTRAQRYTPSIFGYQGTFTFALPEGLDVASASGLALVSNFYGQPKATQRWTFQVRDYAAASWITLGYNDGATYHTWQPLTFPLAGDFSRFVNAARELSVRYFTYSPADWSDLDVLVFAVTTFVPDPPPPPPYPAEASGLRSVFSGAFTNVSDQLDYVANVHDLVITSSGKSKIAAIHATNPDTPVYRYGKVAGASPSDPRWDQVVAAGLLWNGPSGNPVVNTQFGWNWLDVTTAEKRAAWVEILVANLREQLALGYDAVYLDNCGIIDPSLINEYPLDYSDSSYYAAIGDVLARVRAALPGVQILINSYTGGQPEGRRGLEYLPYVDGLSFEAFSMKASSKFMDRARWLQQLGDFARTVDQGKLAVAMDYMQVGDIQRRMWSLASYLLVNAPEAYHRILGTNTQADLQEYAEDKLDLGDALGALVLRDDGLVERRYTGGRVIANPDPAAITYTFDEGAWESLTLNGGGTYPSPTYLSWQLVAVPSISLPPNTAMVVRPAQVVEPPPSSEAVGVRSVFAGSFSNTPDQIDYVANVHDLAITSAGPSKIAALHAANPDEPIFVYDKIAGSDPSDPRWNDVVAAGLLWYGPSGSPVTQTQFGWYWLDIGTAEKRAAWVQILVADIEDLLTRGYDGVYLDNCGIIDPSLITEFPADYSDDTYYANVGLVLAEVRAALPAAVKILINSYTGGQPAGRRGLEYLPYVDGMSFEAFSMKASTKFMDRTRWIQQLTDFSYALSLGKFAIAMDYMQTGDMQRRMWSLASYLLVNTDAAYHRIAGTNVQADLQQYPEDQLPIGGALTGAIERPDGMFERTYTGGTVVANPNAGTTTYTLGPGNWESLVLIGGGTYPSAGGIAWQVLTGGSITLAPNTAVIVRPSP